jgi:hypothetical protein
MMRQTARAIPVLLAVLSSLGGCAASVKRVLPDTIHTVAIARFQNTTDQDLLPTLFDEDLRRSFRLDGRLTVVEDRAAADAVLDGVIGGYTRQPSRFSANNVVEEYVVGVTVELTLTARAGHGTIWVDRGAKPGGPPGPATRRLATDTHFVVVPASGLPVETEEDAQRRIVRDLAEAAVVRVLEGW